MIFDMENGLMESRIVRSGRVASNAPTLAFRFEAGKGVKPLCPLPRRSPYLMERG
jgi:hypothetical protein